MTDPLENNEILTACRLIQQKMPAFNVHRQLNIHFSVGQISIVYLQKTLKTSAHSVPQWSIIDYVQN